MIILAVLAVICVLVFSALRMASLESRAEESDEPTPSTQTHRTDNG